MKFVIKDLAVDEINNFSECEEPGFLAISYMTKLIDSIICFKRNGEWLNDRANGTCTKELLMKQVGETIATLGVLVVRFDGEQEVQFGIDEKLTELMGFIDEFDKMYPDDVF